MTNSGGRVSELTDGFAMGITMLVTMTGLEAADILSRCRQLLRNPEQPARWIKPGVPDEAAGEWPDEVTTCLASLVVGLSLEHFKDDRMKLPDVLTQLEALCIGCGVGEEAAKGVLAAEAAARQPLPE
eukprot:655628-Prymnesium_polylepis.1